MAHPEIKVIAVSNVYSRLMHFKKEGDYEEGHAHEYDHGTLVAAGSLKVEMLDENGEQISERVFYAPNFIFIDKNKAHRLTALQDNTIAACIHAMRTVDEELVDPEFLIFPMELADGIRDRSPLKLTIGDLFKKKGMETDAIAHAPDTKYQFKPGKPSVV